MMMVLMVSMVTRSGEWNQFGGADGGEDMVVFRVVRVVNPAAW